MLRIVILGLMITLAHVSNDCGQGSGKVTDFDWNKVGIIELT